MTADYILPLKQLVRGKNYKLTVSANENFVVVMPTYWEGLPSILIEYVGNAEINFIGENHYRYFVATYGCDYGNILSTAQKLFARKGITFSGLCARQCPLDAIQIQNNHPVWIKPKCTLCLGCFHRCPKGAVDYDGCSLRNGQYFNKNVVLDD